jgi:hypothetical protein
MAMTVTKRTRSMLAIVAGAIIVAVLAPQPEPIEMPELY